MGQLVRGLEGTGCHNFYPDCPFSNQDVLQIARRINFTQWFTDMREYGVFGDQRICGRSSQAADQFPKFLKAWGVDIELKCICHER